MRRNILRIGLKKQVEESRETLVLSHEELSGSLMGRDKVDPLVTAQNMKRIYPESKVLLIIREQISYLVSLYAFLVAIKGVETRSFRRFLREEGERGLLRKLEYSNIIGCYQNLFGRDRVLVLPLEMFEKEGEIVK